MEFLHNDIIARLAVCSPNYSYRTDNIASFEIAQLETLAFLFLFDFCYSLHKNLRHNICLAEARLIDYDS